MTTTTPGRRCEFLDPLAYLGLAARQCKSFHDAEDLCQAAALRMLAAKTRAIRDDTRYFVTCLRNVAIDAGRKIASRRKRLRCAPLTEDVLAEPVDHETPSHILAVRLALDTLSEDDRAILWMQDAQGRSFQAIGKTLAISAATACRRCHLARERFIAAYLAELDAMA